MGNNRDLTVGKPSRVLWSFCLPLFGSILFQQLYNIADSLVAGKFIGENALAAVGNSYEITLIFLAFAFGCNIGCSVIVSQYFGAKNYTQMKSAVYTSMIFSVAVCVVLMIIGLLTGTYLFQLIHTPEEIFLDSKLYLDIYIWGLPFIFFYNIATGIFSALGDSKTPFIFLAASSTANVLTDILFVACFNMGVGGVAWATFICQGISCILAVTFVFIRLSRFHCEMKVKLVDKGILKKFIAVAVPSILQQSFISVGNIVIQGEINSYGAGVIAGYSAAIKLNNMVVTSFTTLGNGISNFTAQNLGADKTERIKDGFSAGTKMVWIICIPIILLYEIAGRYLIMFFMNEPSKEAVITGIRFLTIISPFYFIISLKLVTDGILRGAKMMRQFMVGTFTDLILRVVLALIFSKYLDESAIWWAWPIGWTVSMLISFWFYRIRFNRKNIL